MAAINGKWKLVAVENEEESIKASGGGEKELKEYLEAAKKDVYETYEIDGDTVKAITDDGTKSTTIEIRLGQWCDMPSDDGDSKVLAKELGKDQYAYSIEASKYKATGTRVITGDDMVLTITLSGPGVTTTRRYKRVK